VLGFAVPFTSLTKLFQKVRAKTILLIQQTGMFCLSLVDSNLQGSQTSTPGAALSNQKNTLTLSVCRQGL
jgi:hypothetical protein